MHSTADPRPAGTAVPQPPAAGAAAPRHGAWIRLAGAILGGLALVAAFPPYGIWPLAIVSVAGVRAASPAASGRGAGPGSAWCTGWRSSSRC